MDKRVHELEKKIASLDQQIIVIKKKMKKIKGSGKNAIKRKALQLLKQKKQYEQQRNRLIAQQNTNKKNNNINKNTFGLTESDLNTDSDTDSDTASDSDDLNDEQRRKLQLQESKRQALLLKRQRKKQEAEERRSRLAILEQKRKQENQTKKKAPSQSQNNNINIGYNKDVVNELVKWNVGTRDECIKASKEVIDFNDINQVKEKVERMKKPKTHNTKMKAFMGELEELIGFIQKHLDFMDKQDSVVNKIISKSNEKNRLQSAKKIALKNEKELLEQIMNINEMHTFLNDIILIENLFNSLYSPKKSEQEQARNKFAKNIRFYENKRKPISQCQSFVDILFDGTMLGIGEFKKWLQKVEDECKKQGIKIIDNSGAKGKNIERAFYKAFYVYGVFDNNGFKQMTDVLRCSLVFDNFDHLYRCFNVIEVLSKDNNNGGILRCKDRFNPQTVEFGYRDLLINMYCPQSKIVCEIQLHYITFYKYKKISHAMYKKARLFEDVESDVNLAYRYADKNNRKHIGDKIYQVIDDGNNDDEKDGQSGACIKLLKEWKLDKYGYETILFDQGYDDVDEWDDLTVIDLKEMGFKPGHAKKFIKYVGQMN